MQAPPHCNHSRRDRPPARDRPAADEETSEIAAHRPVHPSAPAKILPPARPLGQPDLRHLDGAYNLARWLTRSDEQAHEVVQQAVLEAYVLRRATTNHADMRSRLMSTVRSACYARLQRMGAGVEDTGALDRRADDDAPPGVGGDPRHRIDAALQRLPIEFREVIVLRDMEELSYAAISSITGVPVCAVMSRLGLARARLARQLER